MPGGTVEQQKIEKLQKIEEDLLQVIERTSHKQGDYPEHLKAIRLLNQIQLQRINLEVQDLR